MNRLNIEFVANYIGRKLPFLLCIDLGVSSSGFIKVIEAALPIGKKYLIKYFRPQNSKNHAVNPFDIGLGSRFLLVREQNYIVSFLMKLVNPPEEMKKEARVLLSEIIKRVFLYYLDF